LSNWLRRSAYFGIFEQEVLNGLDDVGEALAVQGAFAHLFKDLGLQLGLLLFGEQVHGGNEIPGEKHHGQPVRIIGHAETLQDSLNPIQSVMGLMVLFRGHFHLARASV